MMPHGTTVSMAKMMISDRFRPANMASLLRFVGES